MRIRTSVVPSLLILSLVAGLTPAPAEAGGRRVTGVRRAAPRRSNAGARRLPAAPVRAPVPAPRAVPVAPRAVPAGTANIRRSAPFGAANLRRSVPLATRPQVQRRQQVAPSYRAPAPIRTRPAVRTGSSLRARLGLRTPYTRSPSGTSAAARAGARRTTRGFGVRGVSPRTVRSPLTARATPVRTPTVRSLAPDVQRRNAAALTRLSRAGRSPGRFGMSPSRLRTRTPVTSRGDTLARSRARRRLPVAGTLGRGNLAHDRLSAPRTGLPRLADRSRSSHRVHGRRGSVRSRRGRRGAAFGFQVTGIDWQAYWHSHHHPGLLRTTRRVVVVRPVPYIQPIPYEYGPYVEPLPYVDVDPYEEATRVYRESEYGPAPEAGYSRTDEDGAAPSAARESAFDRAVAAFEAGDYATARIHLRTAVAEQADDGEAWMAAVQVGMLLGRYDEAADALARASALGALEPGYRFDPHVLFADPQEFDRALERLDREARIHPRKLDAWLLRAYYHVALGEQAEATLAIRHVLRFRRSDPVAAQLFTALQPAIEAAPGR